MPFSDAKKNHVAVRVCQDRHREWLWKLKEATPCRDCGEFFEHYCTDYDHAGDNKSHSISKMLGHSRLNVLEEIKKCELVCILCHRTRTHFRKVAALEGLVPKNQKTWRKRLEVKEFVDSLKASPCLGCHKTFKPWQMEFDHRPCTIKLGSICSLINSLSKNRILEEIAKCDLVCALCHRRRTHGRKDYVRERRQAAESTGRESWRINHSIREQDKEPAVQMYLAGQTQEEVAEFCDVSIPVVRKLLDERGITRRERTGKLPLGLQEEAERLYVVDGMPSPAIGVRLGVTEDVVRLCLKRRGVTMRTRQSYAGQP